MTIGDEPRRHLLLAGKARPEPYTYPHGGGAGGIKCPTRDRIGHSTRLLAEIDQARREIADVRSGAGADDVLGMSLELESEPGFELAIQSLHRRRDGIELTSVRQRGDVMLATVFVAEGKLPKLERLVRAYRDEDASRSQLPKNRVLVESVSKVRAAVMASFWTDDVDLYPLPNETAWWEVWLRVGEDREAMVERFARHATSAGMRVKDGIIRFADRSVKLAFGTREQLSSSVELLDCLAELRLAKETPEFFLGLTIPERAEWIRDLVNRSRVADSDAPAVCLLDTGVNYGHLLLAQNLAATDALACDPTWGVTDHHGHGTEMAGLALLGDLTEPLKFDGPVAIEHRLESVKILPPSSHAPTEPELYGSRTIEAVGRIEIAQPARRRVLCSAVTAPDYRDRGTPSSWSAALDSLAAGVDDDQPRLITQAGGNVRNDDWSDYPDRNDVDQVHDPAQAWNALTVGAFTDKVVFDACTYPDWTLLAPRGGLSPSSTTSLAWDNQWPNKPDIVLEGGNAIRAPITDDVETPDSLRLLTTDRNPSHRVLTTIGDTSAAAAQASRMAATLMARNPDLWPEAVRGLLVHSADWTPEMVAPHDLRTLSSDHARRLLRR